MPIDRQAYLEHLYQRLLEAPTLAMVIHPNVCITLIRNPDPDEIFVLTCGERHAA